MNGPYLVAFVGWAAVFAGVATLACAAPILAVSPRAARRWGATIFAVLFFVALTQHPFPDPKSLHCPVGWARPNLMPLHFVWRMGHTWSRSPDFAAWLIDSDGLQAVMNLLLCGAIGAALSRHALGMRTATLAGLALSAGVELTQLTGIWGLYPCAYRRFDVDDLMLNTLGVALGFALARRQARRRVLAPGGAA